MATEADDYAAAIRQALTLVQFAERGDAPSAKKALSLLEAQTGESQPEVLEDLRKNPPDLTDAQTRLEALAAVMSRRTDTSDPARAERELHRILSLPRYAGLRAGPSLFDVIASWLVRHLLDWLLRPGGPQLGLPNVLVFGVAVTIVVALAIWLVRAGLSRTRGDVTIAQPSRVQPTSVDHFAEADHQAAAGDYLAALRALTAGVAVAISGERAWKESPLTVRELFRRATQPEALAPLLQSFEAAAYGHRLPDTATYTRAAQAAEPFRKRAA